MTPHLEVRKILLFPLLILLHLLFIISSLILRIYQHLTTQTPAAQIPLKSSPPKHVAIVLKPTPRSKKLRRRLEVIAVRESIRRAVTWTGQAGIEELSIFDGHGLMQSCLDDIIRDLTRLPPSPPSSSASSPPRRNLHDHTNVDTDDATITYSEDKQDHAVDREGGFTTLTVFPADYTESHKPLLVHLLPPTTSSGMMADLTRSYIPLSPNKITQQRIDIDIKEKLHFTSDPSLLIIHHLSPPSFMQAILPRPPPEISGYPFWPLRITEIYHHPTPLPLPTALIDILRPLLDRAEESSMPLVRKFARAIPREHDGVGPDAGREVYGALRKEEWDGAMKAWGRVEQRLGR